VLQRWATVAATVAVLGVSAYHAVAQAKLSKKALAIKINPREIKVVRIA
jgi:hypothetical protein